MEKTKSNIEAHPPIQFIDDKSIATVLRMEDLIPLMRETMIAFSRNTISQPARRILSVAVHNGYFASMSAVSERAVGAKLVTFYPDNNQKQLPTHMAAIMLFKPETGEPLALLDGGLITEMRTAAVSAVFIDAVAGSKVKSLAVLGAGVQGRSHLQALSHVRDFTDIRIWNRSLERAQALADSLGARVTGREEAVADAEVVIVATASPTPVLQGSWLRKGAKVVSVGWAGAEGAELDAKAMSNVVIVDSRDGALTESGNVLLSGATIHAELGEVLDGTFPLAAADTVVFDSIGMACQDLAAASLVLDKLGEQS